MKKRFLSAIVLLTVLSSCGGDSNQEAADKMCECYGPIAEDMIKMTEDPTAIDMTAYSKKMEDVTKCLVGDATEASEIATEIDASYDQEKVNALVKEACPDVAKAMNI